MQLLRTLGLFACILPAVYGLAAPPAKPTNVYFQVTFNSLRKISSVDSTFINDFYINLAWRDDRLFTAIGGQFDPMSMFEPAPEFINAEADYGVVLDYNIIDAADIPEWVGVTKSKVNETWVVGVGRKQGAFVAELELKYFPFDRQNASIIMESSKYEAADLQFIPLNIIKGINAAGTIGGWDALSADSSISNYTYPAMKQSFSRAVFTKMLARQYRYYLSRIVTNVVMIVVMSACK